MQDSQSVSTSKKNMLHLMKKGNEWSTVPINNDMNNSIEPEEPFFQYFLVDKIIKQ